MSFYLDIVEEDGTIEEIEVESTLQIKETTKATPVESATHLLIKPEEWGWEQLRDYVTKQVEHYHGAQVRNPIKEKAIFQSFLNRWGDQASAIARYAFEVQKGIWMRAPITVNRFSKGSDEYFAGVISSQLEF